MPSDAQKNKNPSLEHADGMTARLLRVWWILYGVGLITMALVTPPFQVPDEPHHFFRVYQLAEGRLLARPAPTGTGGWIPCSLNDLRTTVARGIPFNPQAKFTFQRWLKAWHIPAKEEDRCHVEFANTAVYSPVVYIPHVAGLFSARLLRLPLLAWVYAARLAGALAIWLLTRWCMRLAPARWSPVFLLLLMAPMFMFEAAAITADSLTNITAFIFMALLLDTISGDTILTRKRLFLLTGIATALALCKPPYVLLAVLIVLIPGRRFESPRDRFVWVTATLVLAFSIGAAWNLSAEVGLVMPSRFQGATDPKLQMACIRENPLAFAAVLLRTFKSDAGAWLQQWVGMLGWLDVRLPIVLIWLYYVAFFLLAISAPRVFPQPGWIAMALLAIPIIGSLLTLSACYTTFTPVRHPVVLGFQGRYLIPWSPLFAAVLASIPWRGLKNMPDRVRCTVALCMGGVSFLVAVVQLVRRYYVP